MLFSQNLADIFSYSSHWNTLLKVFNELYAEAPTGGIWKSLLKGFPKFRGKHLRWILFFNKDSSHGVILHALAHVFSFEFSEIFKGNFFQDTSGSCSCICRMHYIYTRYNVYVLTFIKKDLYKKICQYIYIIYCNILMLHIHQKGMQQNKELYLHYFFYKNNFNKNTSLIFNKKLRTS